MRTCPGCGLDLPISDGPTHAYVVTSPECWALFNETMVNNRYRLLTDAYMAQHPDGDDPRQVQSVAAHLVTLHAVLVRAQPITNASRITAAAVELGRASGGFRSLERPRSWELTIGDVATGDTTAEAYAGEVLAAWERTEGSQIESWSGQSLESLYG